MRLGQANRYRVDAQCGELDEDEFWTNVELLLSSVLLDELLEKLTVEDEDVRLKTVLLLDDDEDRLLELLLLVRLCAVLELEFDDWLDCVVEDELDDELRDVELDEDVRLAAVLDDELELPELRLACVLLELDDDDDDDTLAAVLLLEFEDALLGLWLESDVEDDELLRLDALDPEVELELLVTE